MYGSKEELISLAKQNSIEVMDFEKQGDNDGLLIPGCKNVVHAVFQYFDPHGDVYAYISEWLSNYTTQGKFPLYVILSVHLRILVATLEQSWEYLRKLPYAVAMADQIHLISQLREP